jgi:hypothetical protein
MDECIFLFYILTVLLDIYITNKYYFSYFVEYVTELDEKMPKYIRGVPQVLWHSI